MLLRGLGCLVVVRFYSKERKVGLPVKVILAVESSEYPPSGTDPLHGVPLAQRALLHVVWRWHCGVYARALVPSNLLPINCMNCFVRVSGGDARICCCHTRNGIDHQKIVLHEQLEKERALVNETLMTAKQAKTEAVALREQTCAEARCRPRTNSLTILTSNHVSRLHSCSKILMCSVF